MNEAAKALLNHLRLEPKGHHTYTSIHANDGGLQVFGGQLMAQAIHAAADTVPADRALASFQTTFSSPAEIKDKIDYRVVDVRSGKSFSQRQIVGQQGERPCVHVNALFQKVAQQEKLGARYQVQPPDQPGPDQCLSQHEVVAIYHSYYPDHLGSIDGFELPPQPLDIRFVNPQEFFDPTTKNIDQRIWVRMDAELGHNLEHHKQILIYATDLMNAHLAAQPQGWGGLNPRLRLTSLDHALWFHGSFRMDDWLLMVRRCRVIHAERALISGEVFDAKGSLVATLAQQALVRLAHRVR